MRRSFEVLLVASALAACGAPWVPWPDGEAPTPKLVEEQAREARELEARERTEEIFEASEIGEDSEHVVLEQRVIDEKHYGDLAGLFRIGDGLFNHEFHKSEGYGDAHGTARRRVHKGVRGGLDTFSCGGCHSVGGNDGAGTHAQNAFVGGDGERFSSASVRNAPAMLGLGLVQELAAEMTEELRAAQGRAKERSEKTHADATEPLVAKGISFGAVTARADGSLDTSHVEGVSADLEVRPFGWKGSLARLRRFIEEALRIHFGMQSHVMLDKQKEHLDRARVGDGPWFDADLDNKPHEIEEGTLTAGAVYLAMLEAPVILPPSGEALRARWKEGSELFDRVGCASCHARTLHLERAIWRETCDTTEGVVAVQLLEDGDLPRGSREVELFSDLKRHDMGPTLADPNDDPDGIPRAVFLTRPLWGLAETAPYLHDGRAGTIPEAILGHGGEATKARDAFAALAAKEQASLHVFLLSLTRTPRARIAP